MKKSSTKNKIKKYNQTDSSKIEIIESIKIPNVITVKELSEKTKIPAVRIISELMKNGVLAAINESIDYETATLVCDFLGVQCELDSQDKKRDNVALSETDSNKLKSRPPVVTIMGHVDHGKTTLLDKIRTTSVVDSESGGITQHISAYQVLINGDTNNKKTITFIDTPGHAAFSALRSHGTLITDIVVLIVAANDGVMPQTIEVIEQCQKNNVPMIVAINKVDLPDADPMKVKTQLADYNLVSEDWGGKTLMVEISAKSGLGIDKLLETIILESEILDLKADPEQKAFGVVIESHMHKGAGPLALVLIENGTLKKGDAVQIGKTWGKVRILENYLGQPIESAQPSCPARIAGLRDIPAFGDHLVSFNDEKEAKDAAQKYQQGSSVRIATAKKLSKDNDELENSSSDLEYRLVIKADVQGSAEAINKLLQEIDSLELKIKVVGEGVGGVSESDVTLAKAAKAKIFAFRVPVLASSRKIAEKENIEVKKYDVIYELIDQIKSDLTAMLPQQFMDKIKSKGKVLAIFRNDKKAVVIGSILEEGNISKNDKIRFLSQGEVVSEGEVTSLRREKNEVSEVNSGVEFGICLGPLKDIAVNYNLETYQKEKIIRKIS